MTDEREPQSSDSDDRDEKQRPTPDREKIPPFTRGRRTPPDDGGDEDED